MRIKTGRYLTRYGTMEGGQAAKAAFEVVPSPNGFEIHQTDEPHKPEPGQLFDAHEQPISHNIVMGAQIDAKTKAITLTPLVASLITVVIALIAGGVSIWLYSISSAMSYQQVVNDVTILKERVAKIETMDQKVNALVVTGTATQKDVETIKRGQDDSERDRKEMMKNVADIRILLAQKGMQ